MVSSGGGGRAFDWLALPRGSAARNAAAALGGAACTCTIRRTMSQTRRVTRQGKGWTTRAACRVWPPRPLRTAWLQGGTVWTSGGGQAPYGSRMLVDGQAAKMTPTPGGRPLAGCWTQGRVGLLWASGRVLAGGSLPHSLRATV